MAGLRHFYRLASRRSLVSFAPRVTVSVKNATSSLFFRKSSNSAANLDVSIDETTGIAILQMQRKPVNSMSLEMLTDLNIALEKLENDTRCRGLVITSVFPKTFCAGLELTELYQPKEDRLVELWRMLQEFWLKLYGSRLVTSAAINGHCIAGGCLIALACDHRVMSSGSHKIGLNESMLGLEAPLWLMDSMVNVIGRRAAERALILGELYLPDEALRIGLVDEVVSDPTHVRESARQQITKWLQVPGHARQLTKVAVRRETIERMIRRQEESLDYICSQIRAETTQRVLANYLDSLKQKKK